MRKQRLFSWWEFTSRKMRLRSLILALNKLLHVIHSADRAMPYRTLYSIELLSSSLQVSPNSRFWSRFCLETRCDEQLFDNVRRNSQHTLHNLPLPPETLASQNYSLRSRAHNRQLPEHFNHLDDSNFIIRMLYKTCINPILLTLWTRFLSYNFIVVL